MTPKPFDVHYTEGSDVGYRGFAKSGDKPLYPFGYGLTYSSFRYSGLKVAGGKTLHASFTVTNIGARPATDTPQLYLTAGSSRTQQRLIGWSKVDLRPGERRTVTVTAPQRLLANWDAKAHGWRLDGGVYKVALGSDASTLTLKSAAHVAAAMIKP